MSACAGSENGLAFVNFVRCLAGEWYCPMCGTHFVPPEQPHHSPSKWVHMGNLPPQPYTECPVCGRILKSSGEYADKRTRDERRG